MHQAPSAATPAAHLYLWVFFHGEPVINTDKAGGLEAMAGREPLPIQEERPRQPITWVTASQAKPYRDGALGCQRSTKSEGDKGGKAFTTSVAETFVTLHKANMAELTGCSFRAATFRWPSPEPVLSAASTSSYEEK